MKDLWAWEIIRGSTLYLRPGGNNLYSHIREGVIRRQGLPTIVPRYRDPQLCHATLYLNLVVYCSYCAHGFNWDAILFLFSRGHSLDALSF